ncbi:MAG: YciI family protein [Ferruginibacter sp.]
MHKILFSFIFSLAFTTNNFSQEPGKAAKENSLADKISLFWFVMIKTGPKQDLDSATKAKLFAGHFANINRLYQDGLLKVAGPYGKNDFNWRGIFIFDCATREEAEKLVATDPAIAAGLFAVDIVPWYGEPLGSFKKGKPEKKD